MVLDEPLKAAWAETQRRKQMDDDLKAKWVSALRSGEFLQGREHLHNEGAYCCLGVLCKISGADMSKGERVVEYKDGEGIAEPTAFIDEAHWTEEEELTPRLLEYFGISSGVETKLIRMNDDGMGFVAIADWIETHSLFSGQPNLSPSGV